MAEETVYTDDSVNITNARIVMNGETFAMRNVASVRMVKTNPSKKREVILLIIGGLFLQGSIADGLNVLPFLVAIACIGVAIFSLIKAKSNYHVAISTSAGQVHALGSKNRRYIEDIVAKINEALSRQ